MKNPLETLIKEAVKEKVKTFDEFLALKRQYTRGGMLHLPSNITLFRIYKKLLANSVIKKSESLEKLLQTNKVRSISGVSIITVVTKDYPCPGSCLYCPKEKDIPQSYLSNEPAIMRAVMAGFDPKRQVEIRLNALKLQNHPVDKIELIILGGTFSALPLKYRESFVKNCFDALNGKKSKSLDEAKKLNETSKSRCVGLTIETRPDFINKAEVQYLRYLGVTRIELGVQSPFNDVLRANKRGHGVEEVRDATKLLRDAGFKIGYHMMPGLYKSSIKRDIEAFNLLWDDESLRPDYLKIYPCVVTKGSELYNLWRKNKYKPYSNKELLALLTAIKKTIPYYVRIHRLIRDIPSQSIEAGNKITNLRQIMANKKIHCRCIRCREIQDRDIKSKAKLFIEKYNAGEGREVFLSFETGDRKNLFALLRLRLPTKTDLSILSGCAIIREVHTYGAQLRVGERRKDASQHKNYGKRLIKEAEKIAQKSGYKKLAVISGIGVRSYYKKLGYRLKDEYMVKSI